MSRGDYKIAGGPFEIWIAEVEDQNRIRLPIEIRTTVPWIKAESGTIECVGIPGSAGGVQLEPLATHEALRNPFIEALGDAPPLSSESGKKWVEAARLLATSWRMTVSIESSRISITLPEPTRRAQQLPGAGGTVVVFGFGEILEIWDAVKWHDHVRAVAKTKLSAVSEAIEDLGHR
jgi:hypothetical protein